MKKLFFTAIALVAFSSVSMANTIAVKEKSEKVFDYNIVEKPISVPSTFTIPPKFIKALLECSEVYNDVLTAYKPIVGEEQATAIAQGAWVGCMGVV